MLYRVLGLVIKELLAVLKDVKSRMVLIGPPIIQLVVFGYAATYDLNHVTFAVYNEDPSQASRELVARFEDAPAFQEVARIHNNAEVAALIDNRKVLLVLHIDRRFSRDLLAGSAGPVQLILDGRNSNTALLVLGYANTILTDFDSWWLAQHGGVNPPATLDIRARFNENLESRWFIVPGIVALLTQVVTLLVTALSVAREREAGTFDQLLVTPMRPIDILLGKSIPGVIVGGAEATFIIAAVLPQPETLLCYNRRDSFWGGARGGAAPPRPSVRKGIDVEQARYLRLPAHCQSRWLPELPFLGLLFWI